MVPVLIGWAAYIYFFIQVFTHRLKIGGFLQSALILGVLFIVLILWTVHRMIQPSRKQKQAAAQMSAARVAAGRATVAAADSGSVTFRVAGTTFENDDGTSRQEILQHLKFGDAPWADDPDDLTAELEETEYQGETAFNVLVNGYQVGCVPQTSIRQVITAQQHVATCYVSSVRILGGGTGADGRKLSYGCEITLEY